jgi:hypothetical protein
LSPPEKPVASLSRDLFWLYFLQSSRVPQWNQSVEPGAAGKCRRGSAVGNALAIPHGRGRRIPQFSTDSETEHAKQRMRDLTTLMMEEFRLSRKLRIVARRQQHFAAEQRNTVMRQRARQT